MENLWDEAKAIYDDIDDTQNQGVMICDGKLWKMNRKTETSNDHSSNDQIIKTAIGVAVGITSVFAYKTIKEKIKNRKLKNKKEDSQEKA